LRATASEADLPLDWLRQLAALEEEFEKQLEIQSQMDG
jgi:hypothetical protein